MSGPMVGEQKLGEGARELLPLWRCPNEEKTVTRPDRRPPKPTRRLALEVLVGCLRDSPTPASRRLTRKCPPAAPTGQF
jgi:hypothetical protein